MGLSKEDTCLLFPVKRSACVATSSPVILPHRDSAQRQLWLLPDCFKWRNDLNRTALTKWSRLKDLKKQQVTSCSEQAPGQRRNKVPDIYQVTEPSPRLWDPNESHSRRKSGTMCTSRECLVWQNYFKTTSTTHPGEEPRTRTNYRAHLSQLMSVFNNKNKAPTKENTKDCPTRYIGHKTSTAFHKQNIPKVRHSRGSVMVWGCMN